MQLDHANALNLTVADIVSKRIAVLGASGSGKTNTVARIVEQFLPSIPVTIFDPHGDYFGLRERFPILIAGHGLHVDVRLDAESAPLLAHYSFAHRLPVILDMLLMSEDERTALVVAYCEALWQAAISAPVRLPYMVVIDEAHNFIPEGGRGTAAIKRMKQFANEGRKFGIGMILSTQRAAAISKSVLANCEMLFLHGVNIENDVDAYQSVLPYKAAEVKQIAYALEQGEVLFRQGRRVQRVRILKRETYHAGDTPTLDGVTAPVMQTIDAALLHDLAALIKSPPADALQGAGKALAVTVGVDALNAEKGRADALEAELRLKAARITELESEVEALKSQVERLQARLNKKQESPTLPALQQPLIAASAEQTGRVIERTTTTTERIVEHTSTRSLTLRRNKQTTKFNRLLDDLHRLTKLESAILLTLTESPEVWTADRLARTLDCTTEWAARLGLKLTKTGLVVRPGEQAKAYQGNASHYIDEQFPDLDASALFDRIVAVLA